MVSGSYATIKYRHLSYDKYVCPYFFEQDIHWMNEVTLALEVTIRCPSDKVNPMFIFSCRRIKRDIMDKISAIYTSLIVYK